MKLYCNDNDMKNIFIYLTLAYNTYIEDYNIHSMSSKSYRYLFFVSANKYLSSFLLTKRFRFRPLRICKVSRKLYVEPQ